NTVKDEGVQIELLVKPAARAVSGLDPLRVGNLAGVRDDLQAVGFHEHILRRTGFLVVVPARDQASAPGGPRWPDRTCRLQKNINVLVALRGGVAESSWKHAPLTPMINCIRRAAAAFFAVS